MACRANRWSGRGGVIAAACVVAVVAMGGGCRKPQSDGLLASVAGRITIDGEPVKKGGIQFMPVEKGRPAFSEVRDGAYAAKVPLGRLRVIFSSVKETGREVQVYSSKVAEVVDALPPALREGIEISVAGDDPALHFDLSSTGARR